MPRAAAFSRRRCVPAGSGAPCHHAVTKLVVAVAGRGEVRNPLAAGRAACRSYGMTCQDNDAGPHSWCDRVLGGGTAPSEVRRPAPGRPRPPRVPACGRPGHTRPVRARSLDRLDNLLAVRPPSRALVESVRADQPHLRAHSPGQHLRLRRTGSPPARRRHHSDHRGYRLRARR